MRTIRAWLWSHSKFYRGWHMATLTLAWRFPMTPNSLWKRVQIARASYVVPKSLRASKRD